VILAYPRSSTAYPNRWKCLKSAFLVVFRSESSKPCGYNKFFENFIEQWWNRHACKRLPSWRKSSQWLTHLNHPVTCNFCSLNSPGKWIARLFVLRRTDFRSLIAKFPTRIIKSKLVKERRAVEFFSLKPRFQNTVFIISVCGTFILCWSHYINLITSIHAHNHKYTETHQHIRIGYTSMNTYMNKWRMFPKPQDSNSILLQFSKFMTVYRCYLEQRTQHRMTAILWTRFSSISNMKFQRFENFFAIRFDSVEYDRFLYYNWK